MTSLVLITLQLIAFTPLLQFTDQEIPSPKPWPYQFHALLYMNLSKGNLQISNLWYDWPGGLNLNIIQKQLGVLLYDVEWNNGTTFYYTMGDNGTCEIMRADVGIPRLDFLDRAKYLGTQVTDQGFLCNVWEKVDIIWYYEDVVTKRSILRPIPPIALEVSVIFAVHFQTTNSFVFTLVSIIQPTISIEGMLRRANSTEPGSKFPIGV
ncbi:hypothetical protein LWI28_024531 [Acer negundo]|uniref:Uncharacterized protein n=1 Tax=Acer negundo TaxID=4023 RepID=A0AAD5JK26_ACENE|nr:hypothetical protein LWI28_024531 [Acer negundo]